MKKIFWIYISIMIVTLMSCTSNSNNTSVRVLDLRYSFQASSTVNKKSNYFNLLANTNDINDQGYIFPGDVLNFTIEIEDPNFEIITFLAITFNDNLIRANTSDSLISTRDCGLNICLDFPFEVQPSVSIYTVSDVKFAKVNNDTASAIIDSTSRTSIELEVFEGSESPYVLEAVDLLNRVYKTFTFYENHQIFTIDQWNSLFDSEIALKRRLIFINFEGTTIINSQIYKDGKSENEVTLDDFFIWHQGINQDGSYFGGGGTSNQISISEGGFSTGTYNVYFPHIHFNFWTIDFKDVYFSNIGNTIYIHFDEVVVPMITMSNHTQLVEIDASHLSIN